MQTNTQNDEMEIDLQEIIGLLIHRIWIIAIAAVVCGGIAFAYSKFVLTPQYESTTKVYILNQNENNKVNSVSDYQVANYITKDYSVLITSRNVLEEVISDLDMDISYEGLSDKITVQALTDTRIIAITVQDPEPYMAQLLCVTIRDKAAEHIKNVMNIEAVNVADDANLPQYKSSPSVSKYTLIGIAAGIVLSALIIIIRFLMDDTIKTSEDVEKYLGLSTLGTIPIAAEMEKGKNAKKGKKSKEDSMLAAIDKTFAEEVVEEKVEKKTENKAEGEK